MSLIRCHINDKYNEKWFKIIYDNNTKPFDWGLISRNKKLSFNMVINNMNFPWNWILVFKNKNFTVKNLTQIANILLNTSENCRITEDIIRNIFPNGLFDNCNNVSLIIKQIFDNCNNVVSLISSNKYLTPNIVLNNMNFNWNWTKIFSNANFTMETIMQIPDKYYIYDSISSNPNLTIQFILNNINQKWNWTNISKNPAMTESIIMENSHLPWDWVYVSENTSITINLVKWRIHNFNNNSETQDNSRHYSVGNITYLSDEDLESKIHKMGTIIIGSLLSWHNLTMNTGISIKDMILNSYMPWNGHSIGHRDDLTITQAEELFNSSGQKWVWKWDYIGENIKITIASINKNLNHLSSSNLMLNEKLKYLAKNKHLHIDDIMENINLNWCWDIVSTRSDLTLKHILTNTSLNWDWDYISENLKITIKDVINNIDLKWNFVLLSNNKNLKIEDVVKYMKTFIKVRDYFSLKEDDSIKIIPWDFSSEENYLFKTRIGLKEIIANKKIPLNISFFSNCPAVLFAYIKHYNISKWETDAGLSNYWATVCSSNVITIKFIEKNSFLPWRWDCLSKNPNLTVDFVSRNLDKSWQWYDVTNNESILVEDVVSNLEFLKIPHWQWNVLSKKASLDVIDKNLHLPWNWNSISCNKNLTFDFISKHHDKSWHLPNLRQNYALTSGRIFEITDTNWNSYKNNITINDVLEDYSKEWNWKKISHNYFDDEIKLHVNKHTKTILLTKILENKKRFLTKTK